MKGHDIELRQSSQRVLVQAGGTVLADSTRPLLLFETGLPTRYYLPREDVRVELTGPTDKRTHCPWKGDASHWSASIDGTVLENVAWSYEAPIASVADIAGRIAFYPDRVDVAIDD
jgi:uncharacterized protein (DUF427 family)